MWTGVRGDSKASFVKTITTLLVTNHHIQQTGAMWRREIDLIGSNSGTRILFMRPEIIGHVNSVIIIIIIIIIIIYVCCHRPFLRGNSLELTAIPTAQASSFTLQYFPYYV